MESSRDQCRKEGCGGCETCAGRYNGTPYAQVSKSLKGKMEDFTDEQLQAELKRRKREKQTEETRLAKIRAHNAPIQKEIQALQSKLHSLNLKLKK